MLNTNDKKFIQDSITENNKILVKEMIGLFSATNERIDHVEERLSQRIDIVEKKLGNRIDNVLEKLKEHDIIFLDHGKRLGKLEDKVFAT